jgi:hypothetical protein
VIGTLRGNEERSVTGVPASTGAYTKSVRCRSLRVSRDLSVGLGPNDEVPVVREHAAGQDGEGMPTMGFDHDPLKCLEVVVAAKQVHPAHGTVQDVVDKATRSFAGCSRHGLEASALLLLVKLAASLRQEARERRIISNVKPFKETMRVTNPVRQSRASSREASLAWGRKTVTAKRRQRDQTLCD